MRKHFFGWMMIGVFLLHSCATYKRQFASQEKDWKNNMPASELTLKHTMYLVGDAGNSTPPNTTPILKYLTTKLASAPEASSILFLGDNIYEKGMPLREDSAKRSLAEYRITAQLEMLKDFKGKPLFIPGNHDWSGWGLEGLEEQQKFVESYLNKKKGVTDKDNWEKYFLPHNGCSGPEVVTLNDETVLLVIDSEWWLADWDKEPKINSDCEVKNRATFKLIFANLVKKYRDKNVIIAMHHPMFSYGPHGGGFSVRQHIFPLTDVNKSLYIPFPVVGSLALWLRSAGVGSRQDIANRHYKDLQDAILSAVKKNGNFIFVAGHEHTLQLIEKDGQSVIISGSGSKNNPVMLGKGSQFASGESGFSTVDFYEGGETWVQFWGVNADGTEATLIFRKKIKDHLPVPGEKEMPDYSEYDQHKDTTVSVVTATVVKPVGSFHNVIFGKHYRDVYLQQYPFVTFDARKYKDGIIPLRQGGGNQTNSLRLQDEKGKEYVMRSTTKDAARFLPFPFSKITSAKYLVEDNFLSTHPFAPLAFPVLANAINVYHTNPQLYYVPNQPGLEPYNKAFEKGVSLLEERPNGKKWKEDTFFGEAEKIISTPDLIGELLDDNKNKVDEAWALRTRLLDILTGDWDRHDDQWTWAMSHQPDGSKRYRPIPRDRDQAFSKYDGVVTAIARMSVPFLRQLQPYGPKIKKLKWATWSGRLFDNTFLNELTWPEWEAQVKFVQEHLTDSVITAAFATWPDKARELSAPFLISSLQYRRDHLMETALQHYAFVNKDIEVVGSSERELFAVQRIDDLHTGVTMYDLSKKGKIKEPVFQRVFDNTITHAINIYGNGGSDEFIVNGNVSKGITIRLIGGTGKDIFTDSSNVQRGARKTLVYDDLRNNTVNGGKETRDKRTTLYRYNMYDRRGYDNEYDILLPVIIAGYNPDDGILLGRGQNLITYRFKKEPYASNQHFGVSYAFATNAFKFNYTGDFLNVFKAWDLYIDAFYKGPTFSFNYAGLGNSTVKNVDEADYYRVRQSVIHVYPAFRKRFSGTSGSFSIGPMLEISDIQPTKDRYISSGLTGLGENIFKTKYYSGVKTLFEYNNVDNFFAPSRGMRFSSYVNWLFNLKENKNFAAWRTQLSIYRPLDRKERFIVATQAGMGTNFGEEYEFFQMPTIGGLQGLRGYRTERFYGKTSLWHSTDLRARITSSYNKTLPFTVGVFGSFDYGSVWLEQTPSNGWHYSYGGGIWLAPLDFLILSVGAYVPKEATEEKPRIVFRVGFGL